MCIYLYIYLNKLSSGAWALGIPDHPWQPGPLGLARSAWHGRAGLQLAGFSWLAPSWQAPVGWFQLAGFWLACPSWLVSVGRRHQLVDKQLVDKQLAAPIKWLTTNWLTTN